jgi:hypothetical protein
MLLYSNECHYAKCGYTMLRAHWDTKGGNQQLTNTEITSVGSNKCNRTDVNRANFNKVIVE